MRVALCTLVVVLALAVAQGMAWGDSVTLAGITLGDSAFADEVISTSSSVSYTGTSLEASVVGYDLLTRVGIPTSTAGYVQIGFTDNLVVNGTGDDLVLFELGRPEDFDVYLTIGGTRLAATSIGSGYSTSDNYVINLAYVDLSDLGVAAGAAITSLYISTATELTGPNLAAVGALHSTPIPEPGTLTLLGLALAGIAWRRRRS